MQVPVFWTRQVFVKISLMLTLLLSGMVTSLMNLPPFVQSSAFSGGSGVAVAAGSSAGVGDNDGSSMGVDVGTRVSVGGTGVSVGDAGESSGACVSLAPQADSKMASKRRIGNIFLDISVSLWMR